MSEQQPGHVPQDPNLPPLEQPQPAVEEMPNEDQEKYDGGDIPPASPERVEQVEQEQGRREAEESLEEQQAEQVVADPAAPPPPPPSQAAN